MRVNASRRGERLAAVVLLLLVGCGAPKASENPIADLANTELAPQRHIAAMEALDARPDDPDTIRALRSLMYQPGYTVEARQAAFTRLADRQPEQLKETISLRLPTLTALEWRRRLCELIAQRGWKDLSPTLARAWATPIAGWVEKETDRPEYLALAAMHGADHVEDVVFDIFIESRRVDQARLRARCWELLQRLGERSRLEALVRSGSFPADDVLLNDLRAALEDLGILAHNMEEILWLQQLRQPGRAEFWSAAAAAIHQCTPEVRAELELRNLPVIVSAMVHEPALLQQSKAQLYEQVSRFVKRQKRHAYTVNFDGFAGEYSQELHEWRGRLTWGDLAAILMATRALQVPQVVEHLFDYAERDRADVSTEYGGVIRLDEKNRFEVIEFLPRLKVHDNRFDAPQAMFDAGYSALFHFHLHAQRYENETYAGPHIGDLNYADATRANCLVFTFVDRDVMNVDFYRHDRVIVDLGEILRPPAH